MLSCTRAMSQRQCVKRRAWGKAIGPRTNYLISLHDMSSGIMGRMGDRPLEAASKEPVEKTVERQLKEDRMRHERVRDGFFLISDSPRLANVPRSG